MTTDERIENLEKGLASARRLHGTPGHGRSAARTGRVASYKQP
jgi:hypothetical protein